MEGAGAPRQEMVRGPRLPVMPRRCLRHGGAAPPADRSSAAPAPPAGYRGADGHAPCPRY